MNIAEIELQLAELVKEPFDQREFALRLLEIYNAPKATVTKLRTGTQNKGEQPGDVLWSRKLYFRVAGDHQAATTLDALRESKATKSQKPRFLLATDGHEVAAYDTKADEPLHCDYDKLNDHFDFFLPLAGIEKYETVAENPADIKAAGRLAKLHDEIERCNPDWLVPDKRHPLNQFLTRILFCMFAEDTGSFPPDLFVKTVSEFGGADGEHLQSLLKQIFDVMNVPEDQRGNSPAHIRAFPYVNGGLFADSTEVPAFNRRAKRMLVEAAQLDWREINPDIFGSMIQAVVDTEMRGDLGMHYTSVPNIMKVLQPLFLMSLEEEFERARSHREERSLLRKLLTRISKIRVFDPACGSGNFLIIAYRELRKLEMRIFQRLDEIGGGQATWREQSGVKLSNFYGIELADFAAETTKLSLWIAEYQMNQKFKSLFGEAPKSFPLREGGHIICDNALRLDWFQACPRPMKVVQKEKIFDLARVEKVHASEEVVDAEAETYIVGNPPYQGSKGHSDDQKKDMAIIFAQHTHEYKTLDYVSGWYFKAAEYARRVNAQAAFVATNSICQGEQVAMLWPLLFDRGMEIGFAHRSFKWRNLAAKNAGVTCVIVGLRQIDTAPKTLYDGDLSRRVKHIGPYLIEMPNIIVKKSAKPLNSLPLLQFGNHPYYGTSLIMTAPEKNAIVGAHPNAERIIRRLIGSQELLKGVERYCLWIRDDDLEFASSIPGASKRISDVREKRLASDDPMAHLLASRSHQFREMNESREHAIIIPRVSSETRAFIPAIIADRQSVANEQVFVAYDAPIYLFSLISSSLHIVWIRTVCGQLETRLRYSNTLGYNTFPVPTLSAEQRRALEDLAWTIIAARETHPGKTIAWLYDPETMPGNLRDAHHALDDMVEKIYIGRPFKNDTERLEHLFKLYAVMTSGMQKEVALA
jgi:hypothetical protein